MTRAEAYAEGFHEGCRWAERDLADGGTYEPVRDMSSARAEVRALYLGYARGYRDTVARYEAGTLTRQMFEHAPRSGVR